MSDAADLARIGLALADGVIRALVILCLWHAYRALSGDKPLSVTMNTRTIVEHALPSGDAVGVAGVTGEP